MWHDSVCNTVQEPTATSIIVAQKTTTWGESGFPSEFLEPSYNDYLAALTYRRQRRLTIWATCLITASVIVSIITLTLTLYSRPT